MLEMNRLKWREGNNLKMVKKNVVNRKGSSGQLRVICVDNLGLEGKEEDKGFEVYIFICKIALVTKILTVLQYSNSENQLSILFIYLFVPSSCLNVLNERTFQLILRAV